MTASFLGITIENISLGGTVLLLFLLVMFGVLIPRWVVAKLLAERDDRIAESQGEVMNWQKAYQQENEARQLQGHQLNELLHLVKSLHAQAGD